MKHVLPRFCRPAPCAARYQPSSAEHMLADGKAGNICSKTLWHSPDSCAE